MKFTILTIVSGQFGGMKYIHIVVQTSAPASLACFHLLKRLPVPLRHQSPLCSPAPALVGLTLREPHAVFVGRLVEQGEIFRGRLVMVLSSPLTGDLESAPVLRRSREDGCFYEFEWHTAAACVLSRTEGDNCTVFDSQAGVCPSGTRVVSTHLGLRTLFKKIL